MINNKKYSILNYLYRYFNIFIIIILSFIFIWYYFNKKTFYSYLKKSTEYYKESQINLIKTHVDRTLKIINTFYKTRKNDILNEKSDYFLFLKDITSFTFGKNNNLYIFIIDFNGNMLAHPVMPELVGKNLINLQDKKGYFLVKNIIKIANQKGSGFVKYFWENPYNKKISEKLTYINSNRNLNIIVCSGIYIEDILKQYNFYFINLRKQNNIKIYILMAFLLIMTFLLFIFFNKIILKLRFDLNLISNFFKSQNTGKKLINISKLHFKEIKNISHHINIFIGKLNENISFLKILFDNLPIPLFIETEDFKIIDCNLAVEKLYKFKKQELIGKDLSLIVPENVYKDILLKQKQEIFKNIFSFESTNKKKDGSIFSCIVNSSPIKINNNYLKLISIIDISRQKEYEKKLLNEKLKMEKYFDTAPIIIIIMDKKGIIQLINKNGCKLLNYKKEEIIGQNWFDKFLPEKTGKQKKELFFKHQKKDKNKIITDEDIIINSKGEKRIIRWSSVYLKSEDGKTIGMFSAGEDITEIKKMENQIQKIKNIENLGTLAGGIAHDFNNILTGITANISFLKTQISPENFELVNDIEFASKKALHLSTQLLTFAKGGNPILKPESIIDTIKETVNFYTSGSKIKINIEAPDNLWNVHIDRDQISQVFSNLIINSLQAMKNNYKIDITLSNKRFLNTSIYVKNNILQSGNYVKIIFKDYGKGIPKEILPKIFNPYFTTKKNGNGLGLSIVYSIIKKHKGYIEVYSRQNEGTTFTIYLKATLKKIKKRKKEKNITDLIKIKTNKENKTILILEDNEIVQNTFKTILEKLNFKVFIFNKSKNIIKKVKELINNKTDIKLIILDLTVKDSAGGIETAKKIQKIDKNLNIVLTTGYFNNSILNEYKKYGFKAYLKKPFTAHDLIELIGKF